MGQMMAGGTGQRPPHEHTFAQAVAYLLRSEEEGSTLCSPQQAPQLVAALQAVQKAPAEERAEKEKAVLELLSPDQMTALCQMFASEHGPAAEGTAPTASAEGEGTSAEPAEEGTNPQKAENNPKDQAVGETVAPEDLARLIALLEAKAKRSAEEKSSTKATAPS